MTSTVISVPLRRLAVLFGTGLLVAAALTLAAPQASHASDPRGAARLVVKPKPPQHDKAVFQRTKPHLNYNPVPTTPKGPTSLKGEVPELADWYCGEGSGPGGYATCTKDLIASCSGTYVPPKTNGEHQTWGMCHESSG